MQTLIGTGGVATSAEHVTALANSTRGNKRFRSDGIARALWATNQSQHYPVVGVLDHVSQEGRRRIHIVDHHIDVAIIEQVSKRGSARRHYGCQPAAGCGRNFLKFRSIKIPEKQRTLRPGRSPILLVYAGIDVGVGGEKIEQTVV